VSIVIEVERFELLIRCIHRALLDVRRIREARMIVC
jgi:hypothetical protein